MRPWSGEREQAGRDQKGGEGLGHHQAGLGDQDGVAGDDGRGGQALDLGEPPAPGGECGQPDGSQAQDQVESEDAGLERLGIAGGESLNGGEQVAGKAVGGRR